MKCSQITMQGSKKNISKSLELKTFCKQSRAESNQSKIPSTSNLCCINGLVKTIL